MRFERGDMVNNGFATFRVLRYLTSGKVYVSRMDRGSTVCLGTAEFDEDDLSLGGLNTHNPNRPVEISNYTADGIFVGSGDIVFE